MQERPLNDEIAINNLEIAEELYAKYLESPSSVETSWQKLFETFQYSPQYSPTTPSTFLNENKAIYSNKIGFEYAHIDDPELKQFILESIKNHKSYFPNYSKKQKLQIFEELLKAELLEAFLHRKFIGQKRFSLEGAETLIPMLKALIERASFEGIEEVFIGMSHRGRLNVLTHILNKPYEDLISLFEEDSNKPLTGSGDVKYHSGFCAEIETADKRKVKIVLTPNPSHLETVNAVVLGEVKASQLELKDQDQKKVLPILIHGDASISGQGVVYETLQLSRLEGYSTGGTVHVVLNNQIGFTTTPKEARSTLFCTDIAKGFGLPIFHVSVEEPESCIYAILLALKIRQKFKRDVFIELNCYRKYGHNETDEPFFTQPLLYQLIKNKKNVREMYAEQLIQETVVEKEELVQLEAAFKGILEKAFEKSKQKKEKGSQKENPLKEGSFEKKLTEKKLLELAASFCKIPENFTAHSKIIQLVQNRWKMMQEAEAIDWGLAEHLAFASLLALGVNIRMTGQDSSRGTFSQRHGFFVDQKNEKKYYPLNHLLENQGTFDLINSPLSEFAALGFEYGYNLVRNNDLTIWEAQFGDFINEAQVVIDEYLASGEQKWGLKSSLVLFLPHGFEGEGPDHSSARIERFLSLAAENNMQIVYPTTAVQLFHLIRRHVLLETKVPLVVFTPKGLLRYEPSFSALKEFVNGSFETVIGEKRAKTKRVIFCSGRVYYDLLASREKNKEGETALIRIEQLYPVDKGKLKEFIEEYGEVEEYFYVQEEPLNMGSFGFLREAILELLPKGLELTYVGREQKASPATGQKWLHKKENQNIMSIMEKK